MPTIQNTLQVAPAPLAAPKANVKAATNEMVLKPAVAPDAFGAPTSSNVKPVTSLHFPWPGQGSAADIGWIKNVQPPTTDATGDFEKLDAAAKAGQSVLPPDANNCVYLTIGGLFSGVAPHELYMDENLDALKSAGLDARRVPVDTDQSVEHNAAIVRQAILDASASGKKVVLIGHSKGGLDAEAALALYPELKDKVRALVTIQSPYGGSPIASDLAEVPGLKTVLGGALGALGGSILSGTELTYQSRQEFLAQHPMPPGIPVVSMASSRLSPLSPLYATAQYMKSRYGIDSDGLVSPEDAFIPGSRTVTLGGLDHLDSTVSELNPFLPYHPQDLTLALVALALQTPVTADAQKTTA